MMRIDENYQGVPRSLSNLFAYHLPGNENNNLQINGLAMKEHMKPCRNIRNQGNADYLILYFYDPVLFKLKDCEYEDAQYKWIILSPGVPHTYGNIQEKWSHSWIHLSGPFFEKLLHSRNIPLNSLIVMKDPHIFENLLIRLHEEIYYNPDPEMSILSNEIHSAFVRLFRLFNKPSNQSNIPDPISEIKQVLDYNYRSHHSLKSLSELSGYSIPYLCEKFSQHYQYPPIEYLIRRRIQISTYFLENTDWNISEIAMKAGYDDLYYFSRLFKKRIGVSPSQYRKHLL